MKYTALFRVQHLKDTHEQHQPTVIVVDVSQKKFLTSAKEISAVSTPDTCFPVATSVRTAEPTVRHGERCPSGMKNSGVGAGTGGIERLLLC